MLQRRHNKDQEETNPLVDSDDEKFEFKRTTIMQDFLSNL